jgi:hypothetical protein
VRFLTGTTIAVIGAGLALGRGDRTSLRDGAAADIG